MKRDEFVQLNARQSSREGSGSLQSYVFWYQQGLRQIDVYGTVGRTTFFWAKESLPAFSKLSLARWWMRAKLKTWRWRDSWLMKGWLKGKELTSSFSLAEKVCSALHSHLWRAFLYVPSPRTPYTRIKGLYVISVLTTPADLYVMYMGISSDQTRSKNWQSPEWRNIREQLSPGGSLGRCWKGKCHSSQQWSDAWGWKKSTCWPILKWKAVSGLNKSKDIGSVGVFKL